MSHPTLSVPLALALAPGAVPDRFPLLLRADSGDDLLDAADRLDWSRVREVALGDLDDLNDFDNLAGLRHRSRFSVLWKGFEVGRLLDGLKGLRRRGVTVQVAPSDDALYDKLVVGESLGLRMAVDLDDPDTVDLAALNQLLSYGLLTGGWRPVSVEPVAALVATAAGRRALTLWDFAQERLGVNLWADDQGRLSLSARLAPSHPFGTLADLADGSYTESPPHARLAGYAESLFRDRAPCATCRSYPLCGGWLRYLDPGYDCEVWQLVLGGVADAVGKSERDRRLRRPAPAS